MKTRKHLAPSGSQRSVTTADTIEQSLNWIPGRYGRIRRRCLWSRLGPTEMPELRTLTPEMRTAFADAVARGEITGRIPSDGKDPRLIRGLTAGDYLRIAGLCYRAIGRKRWSPRTLYRRHADGRHGGLLGLPARGKRAFRSWYWGDERQGAHPFEICRDRISLVVDTRDDAYWLFLNFRMGISYVAPDLIRMALALHHAGVPYSLPHADQLAAFARGDDWVGVVEDQVAAAGRILWPARHGILNQECNLMLVSELRPFAGILRSVRWYHTKLVPVFPEDR